jgi:glucosamine-6-phosphate deaminase
MDEYMGLGKDAPQNFGNFLKKAVFSKKPFHEVNYVQSDAADIDAECARYEGLLKAAPLDIVSLGIGENGHIAFNDPHEAKFNDKRWVRQTSLDDICRQQQVNDGEFSGIDQVPKKALTLTIPALMSCKSVIGIVPNRRKARAVYNTLYGSISETCPASILRTHKDAVLFIDRDAAELL